MKFIKIDIKEIENESSFMFIKNIIYNFFIKKNFGLEGCFCKFF